MRKPFAKRFDSPRLTPEQAERQGRASKLAIDTLRKPEAVIAFLNTHDDAIGGRPIDVAIASAEGLLSVERLLAGAAPPAP